MEYVQQCTLHKLPQVAGHKMGRPSLTGSIGTWFTCLLEVTDQGAKDRCTLHPVPTPTHQLCVELCRHVCTTHTHAHTHCVTLDS